MLIQLLLLNGNKFMLFGNDKLLLCQFFILAKDRLLSQRQLFFLPTQLIYLPGQLLLLAGDRMIFHLPLTCQLRRL
jgi:hypothetical protein